MPGKKSGKKGGKARKRAKGGRDDKRELEFKVDGQEYGVVRTMLGSGRADVYCFDGVTRRCTIRGALQKRVWIAVGDIILVDLRDFEDKKGDISLKYTPDEARLLKHHGEIPASAKINETGVRMSESGAGEVTNDVDADGAFDFEDFDVDIDKL